MTLDAGWITDAINLFLERLDRLSEAIERLADALEESTRSG
jgi:hypothetical protein